MKVKIYMLILLCFVSTLAFSQSKTNLIKQIQGSWVDQDDSLSIVFIKRNVWTFNYAAKKLTVVDTYSITTAKQLPKYVDPKVNAEFIVLTNKTDTLYFEKLGLTNNTLSLMHYPSAKKHLYIKK